MVCVIPPGRFYGLIFGGFIGINLFGWIGGLLLAVLFFFIGGWAGFYLARFFTMRIAPLSSGS